MSRTCTWSPLSTDICVGKCLRELMGNTDIKNALERLDKLTQEEARMANAELLRIAHNAYHKVQDVGEGVLGVQKAVQGVDDNVDQLNRESSDAITLDPQPAQIFTGNHLRSCLRPSRPGLRQCRRPGTKSPPAGRVRRMRQWSPQRPSRPRRRWPRSQGAI